jgi:hypothetical protein
MPDIKHNPKILNLPTRTLLQLLGPSIVFVALSLNGGEMLLWPDLVAQFGLKIIWPIPLILLLQYVVNLEIERYTAVTGKNTLKGLIEINKFIAILFPISILVSLAWPAWGSTAGNILAYIFGVSQFGAWFAVAVLLGLILIWNSKRSYQILETIAKIGLSTVFIIVLGTVIFKWQPEVWSELGSGMLSFGYVPATIDKFAFVSALAFGGVAGVLNLVQSDWVFNRKYAAASHEKPHEIDWNHPETKHSWKAWWKLMTREHFWLFYVGNIVGIFLLAILAFLILTGTGVSGFKLLSTQIDILNRDILGLGYAFGLAVFLLFMMAQMTILDAQGRLLKQCLNTKLSSERLSQIAGGIGILILLGTALIPGFNQPLILLKISASMSAAVMAFYPILLLYLNSRLPKETQANPLSKILVVACSVFYAVIVIWGLIG